MQYCTVKDHPDNANDLTGPSRAVSIIKACHDEAEFYPTMKAVVFWQKLSHLVWSTIQVHFNSSSSLIDILTRVHRTANSSISRISAKSLVFLNRRTRRTVQTGANTVRWTLILTDSIIFPWNEFPVLVHLKFYLCKVISIDLEVFRKIFYIFHIVEKIWVHLSKS